MRKKHFLLYLFLVLCLINNFIPTYADEYEYTEEWKILGDTVYINDSKVFASATPHTLYSSGWVTFEFESKVYEGDVDVVWGFNKDSTKPTGLVYLWNNYTHNLIGYKKTDAEYYQKLYDVVSYENLGMENYDYWNNILEEPIIGNKNNTYLLNVSFQNGTKNTYIAFNDWDVLNGDDYLLTGILTDTVSYEYQKNFFDWKPIDLDYIVKNLELKGMNKWYILKNQSIQQNKRYKIRVWVDVEFKGLLRTYGKYWWGFKPSDETLIEAKTNGHFYYLDPWYNNQWDYRKPITIESDKVSGNLVNFPLCINITDTDLRDKAKSDGGDILFTKSDAVTKLAHEIEVYQSGTGRLTAWVNVTSISSVTDTTIYMYYGNAGAANQSDPSGVWDSDFYTVVHFNQASGTLTDSVGSNTWAVYSTPTFHNSDSDNRGFAVSYDASADGHEDNTPAAIDGTKDMTFEFFVEQEGSDDRGTATFDNVLLSFNGDTKTGCTVGTDHETGNFIINVKENDAAADSCQVDFVRTLNTRYYVVGTFDASDNDLYLYVNSTYDSHDDNDLVGNPDYDNEQDIANNKNNNKGFHGIVDEFRVSTIMRSRDYINATNYTLFDDNFISVGIEQMIFCDPITIESEYPANNAVDVVLSPAIGDFHAIVNISDNSPTNVTAWTNESGIWRIMNWNETGINGTYYFTNTSWVDTLGKTYYWSVNVTNGTTNCWYNESYKFTTYVIQFPPTIILGTEHPLNNSVGVKWWGQLRWNVTIEDINGDTFDWSIEISPSLSEPNYGEDASNGSKFAIFQGMEKGTKYTVFVNATDTGGSNEYNRSKFYFTTRVNQIPYVTNEIVANNSVGVTVGTSTFKVTVWDWDDGHAEEPTDVVWLTNASGSWVQFGTNNSVMNGTTITQHYMNFLGYNKKYYWKVNLSDNDGGWNESIFNFVTQSLPSGGGGGGGTNVRGNGGFLGLGGMGAIFGLSAFVIAIKRRKKKDEETE